MSVVRVSISKSTLKVGARSKKCSALRLVFLRSRFSLASGLLVFRCVSGNIFVYRTNRGSGTLTDFGSF